MKWGRSRNEGGCDREFGVRSHIHSFDGFPEGVVKWPGCDPSQGGMEVMELYL